MKFPFSGKINAIETVRLNRNYSLRLDGAENLFSAKFLSKSLITILLLCQVLLKHFQNNFALQIKQINVVDITGQNVTLGVANRP